MLEQVVFVLVEPQNVDNIGAAMRAMMTMGLSRLRLVRPAPFDRGRLPVIAHRSQPLAEAIQIYDGLPAALADTTYVVGCTGRRRADNRPVLTPHQAAQATLERVDPGLVAFLFGREDIGLAKTDLDYCHALLTIPTDPDYSSVNLAQAVMVVAYELRLAYLDRRASIAPRKTQTGADHLAATGAQTEAMLLSLQEAITAIDFLIPSRAEATLRAIRALLLRAEPTAEEAALITAMMRAIAKSRV